jgi:diguanylate cyclase (GGDEF)-like protein
MLGVPLILSESERGGLFVFFRDQRPFDSGELMLCEQIASHISLVVLKIKALAGAQQRLAEAETLREAVSLVAATLQPDEAVSRILNQLQSVVPYDSASIQILHDDCLEIIGGSGWDDPDAVRGVRFPVPGDNPNTRVIQERGPVILDEAPLYYPNFRKPPHDHINSWLGVPLVVHGNVFGMLAIDKKEPYFYQPHHLRLVLAFADQVAVSLENARLYQSEHQRALELDALRATVADVIAKLDMPTLLRSIVERAASLLDATGGEIGRFDEERQQLLIEISSNLGSDFKGEWLSLGEGVMGHVAETLEPFVVDDYADWEGRSKRYDKIRLHAALAAPMVIGGRLLGVIGVGTNDPHRHYTSSDLTLLNLFAQQAAIAVENARLFDEIQTQAITDMVTGLYNRRGLFEIGMREILRSLRSDRPISVIMFDIDHFKRVNDRYSHAVGDQVLRWLAGMGSMSLRKTDILARYGGEEFAVLLPETKLEDALRIAERFRIAVAETPVETTHGSLHITISCGVTFATGEVPELAVLLDQADTALYLAKQAGRNRTEVFQAETMS